MMVKVGGLLRHVKGVRGGEGVVGGGGGTV